MLTLVTMNMLRLALITICLTLSALRNSAQTIATPAVDQRVELLSIVFRLAGNPEYQSDDNVAYVKVIHQHFDRFAGHPLILYARELRDSNGIGYDAVMSMAVSLSSAPALTPIVPFSTQLPDKRWKTETAVKFAFLLQQFYQDAGCAGFFSAQSNRYHLAAERFGVLFRQLDANWYERFYGRFSGGHFNIIIGLGNGGGNYGPALDLPGKPKELFAIIGSDTFDQNGNPIYTDPSYLPVLIHEFNHSFINPLTKRYETQLQASGEAIFEKEGARMRRIVYSEWETMYSEALVRAAVFRYLKDHNTDTLVADREIKAQQAAGFFWMPALVNLLEQYGKQRKSYPTLDSFMPRIIGFYQQVALHLDQYEQDYFNHCAKVISVSPFENGNLNVDPKTATIAFNFDKPLDGIRYFFGPGKKGIDHYPKPLGFTFSKDNKTLFMKVQLIPNTEYQVNIAGSMMRTNDGYSVQNYTLNFKTSDK